MKNLYFYLQILCLSCSFQNSFATEFENSSTRRENFKSILNNLKRPDYKSAISCLNDIEYGVSNLMSIHHFDSDLIHKRFRIDILRNLLDNASNIIEILEIKQESNLIRATEKQQFDIFNNSCFDIINYLYDVSRHIDEQRFDAIIAPHIKKTIWDVIDNIRYIRLYLEIRISHIPMKSPHIIFRFH